MPLNVDWRVMGKVGFEGKQCCHRPVIEYAALLCNELLNVCSSLDAEIEQYSKSEDRRHSITTAPESFPKNHTIAWFISAKNKVHSFQATCPLSRLGSAGGSKKRDQDFTMLDLLLRKKENYEQV